MDVSFAPRSQVAAWLHSGWRLCDDHEYSAGDWAVVMTRPDNPERLSEDEIACIVERFRPVDLPVRSNVSRAATSRNLAGQKIRTAKRAEQAKKPADILEEENIQLRERLALATGKDIAKSACVKFGLSKSMAVICGLLLRCGFASHGTIGTAIWDDQRREPGGNPETAIRDHVKRLRRLLRSYGISITTIYGEGYAMDEDNRSRCRRLLGADA